VCGRRPFFVSRKGGGRVSTIHLSRMSTRTVRKEDHPLRGERGKRGGLPAAQDKGKDSQQKKMAGVESDLPVSREEGRGELPYLVRTEDTSVL